MSVENSRFEPKIFVNENMEELLEVRNRLEKLQIVDGYIRNIMSDFEDARVKARTNLNLPGIKNIDFQPPLTVVCWEDGVKTFVKAVGNDVFDPEKGASMAIAKRYFNNEYLFSEVIDYFVEKYYKKHPEARTECCSSSFNCRERLVDEIAEMSSEEAENLIELIIDIQQRKKRGGAK